MEEMKKNAPSDMELTQLNLAAMDLQPLVGDFFEQRQKLLEEGNRSHPRFCYAHQFAQADRIIVAAPFWDLSVPAIVKIYIENISVEGITFGCNEDGIYGICNATDLLFITTRGSVYKEGPMEQGARYLEALCQMFGIDSFRCIYAEGMDLMQDQEHELMDQGRKKAKEAGRTYWNDSQKM